jgi:hypothetical protein
MTNVQELLKNSVKVEFCRKYITETETETETKTETENRKPKTENRKPKTENRRSEWDGCTHGFMDRRPQNNKT